MGDGIIGLSPDLGGGRQSYL
jgi:hypothetical protein